MMEFKINDGIPWNCSMLLPIYNGQYLQYNSLLYCKYCPLLPQNVTFPWNSIVNREVI